MNMQQGGASGPLPQGKIGLPEQKMPQVKGPQLNDRDIINDILNDEKLLIWSFGTAANEASVDSLSETSFRALTDIHRLQRQLYNTMFNLGWYSLDAANPAVIQDDLKVFNNYRGQFPFGQGTAPGGRTMM